MAAWRISDQRVANDWLAVLVPITDSESQARYKCPTCGSSYVLNVQVGGVDNLGTQLWCHRCGQGADVEFTKVVATG